MTQPGETLHTRVIAGRRLACADHTAAGDAVVLFCHGFRGEKTGPDRTFVTAARRLARLGISSVRFDQYGSGDSAGEFLESRFSDWVATIHALGTELAQDGGRLVLWGQSMGASASICAAADLSPAAVVAWVPDASIDEFHPGPDGYVEEHGQRVANEYWEQAHAADIAGSLRRVAAPCYLFFGTVDDYVSPANRTALTSATKPDDVVDIFEGYPHSAWTTEQADDITTRSIDFIRSKLI